MKIIVNGLDLSDAIAKVSKALPVRDVAPVLECIKIIAENDKLTLYATDKDLAIEKTIDANVIVGGAFLIPGKIFGEYIRNIASEEDISLETTDENRLTIRSVNSECNISTLDVDDYPETEQISGDHYFAIQECNLREIINNVIFAVATDDSRPMLKGVYFEAKDYVLKAVATDGYRFASSKKALEERVDGVSATVPSRSLNELSKLLSNSENIVKVHIENNHLMVATENGKLFTRLLAGQYIKFDNIIPRDFVATLLVNKDSFERSLNIASIMSRGDKNNLVRFDIEEYSMTISSTSKQYGTAKESVVISLTGKDISCAYNARYINDCLKVIQAETIKMEFAQHNSCVITINGSDEVLYFILPVKQIG
jgi:DNA polymerase-3 subunit beta